MLANPLQHRTQSRRTAQPNSVAVFAGRPELLTQIRRLEARRDAPATPHIVQIGDLEVQPHGRTATWRGSEIDLAPKEFDILSVLARHAGEVVSRSDLFEQAWAVSFSGGARLVDEHIMKLRKKLGDGAELIQTVRGVGYRLVGPKSPT